MTKQVWTLFRADDKSGLALEGRRSDLLADNWLTILPAPGDRVTDHAHLTPGPHDAHGEWFVQEVSRSASWIAVCWCEYLQPNGRNVL